MGRPCCCCCFTHTHTLNYNIKNSSLLYFWQFSFAANCGTCFGNSLLLLCAFCCCFSVCVFYIIIILCYTCTRHIFFCFALASLLWDKNSADFAFLANFRLSPSHAQRGREIGAKVPLENCYIKIALSRAIETHAYTSKNCICLRLMLF